MRLTKKIALFFCLGMIFITIISGRFQSRYSRKSIAFQPLQLTVSAAISLKDALEEIKPIYQKTHQDVEIIYNFSSSGSLQQQIEQGAPVDIFISAANKQMDVLESKKLLLAGTRQKLLTNQLVLVTPKDEKNVKVVLINEKGNAKATVITNEKGKSTTQVFEGSMDDVKAKVEAVCAKFPVYAN
jgi:molybdate transport system substrate-binding protein